MGGGWGWVSLSFCFATLGGYERKQFSQMGFIKQNRINDTGINVYLLGGFNLTMSVNSECTVHFFFFKHAENVCAM